MIGDVLLITEQHKKAVKQLLEYIGDLKKLKKYIIAIGGESGSGKSEISHLLAKEMKKQGVLTKIIHTDNYYYVPPKERSEWRRSSQYSKVGLEEIDWLRLDVNLHDFKESKDSAMPVIDLLTDQVDQLLTSFDGIEVMILDGLYSIKMDVDLKVLLDLTYRETKMAQMVREKEILDEHRLRVLEKEHEAVQSLRSRADLIVTKNFDVVKADKE